MTTKDTKTTQAARKVLSGVFYRKPFVFGLLAIFAIALIFTVTAFASGSGPAIDWQVLAGGGGHASGTNITLDGTLGQPVTGLSTGGSARLSAGYWYEQQSVRIFLPLLRR